MSDANNKTETPAVPVDAVKILEVRNRRSSIYIHFTRGDDDYPVTFHENPLPSFYAALEALKDHAISLSELPKSDAPKIEVTGITVRPKGENAMALIVAKKTLKRNKRVLNISTPILPMYEAEGDEGQGGDHMSAEEAAAVELVISEAKRYVAGERAQGRLAVEEEEKRGRKTRGAAKENIEQFPEMREEGR